MILCSPQRNVTKPANHIKDTYRLLMSYWGEKQHRLGK